MSRRDRERERDDDDDERDDDELPENVLFAIVENEDGEVEFITREDVTARRLAGMLEDAAIDVVADRLKRHRRRSRRDD